MLVAGVAHRTTATATAAGGFPFFLVFHDADNNSDHDKGKHQAYYHGGNII